MTDFLRASVILCKNQSFWRVKSCCLISIKHKFSQITDFLSDSFFVKQVFANEEIQIPDSFLLKFVRENLALIFFCRSFFCKKKLMNVIHEFSKNFAEGFGISHTRTKFEYYCKSTNWSVSLNNEISKTRFLPGKLNSEFKVDVKK